MHLKSVFNSSRSSLDTLNNHYADASLEDDQLLSNASINCQKVALSTEISTEDTNTMYNTPVTDSASSVDSGDDTSTDVYEKNNTNSEVIVSDCLEKKSPCKKRRRFEPLYTKKIELSDFSTPKRARQVINMVKKEAENLSNQNKSLGKQINYYRDKVKTYKDLIGHLKQQNLISRQMELSMMVKYNPSSDRNL